MSLPAVDPANLPAIPLWVRQWIYLLFLLVTIAANCVDAFYETGDPWWLPGALRVLIVLAIVPNILALANARPTAAERTKALRKAELEEWAAQEGAQPVGHFLPEHLQTQPVTARDGLAGGGPDDQ